MYETTDVIMPVFALLNQNRQNVTKYMNRLLRFNFIYQVERRGRNVYYEISPDLSLLEP